jgi:glycosyltransferase involved in cell wall biosynthesis/predicted O-methyltransferase YrrM
MTATDDRMAGLRARAPLLSAVVCTYDRAGLLRRMLESLCAQTLGQEDFEIVVVDDGSTDDTGQVVESFRARLPIRYSRQRNAGLASARNHGLFLARGQLLLFLDDDDVADPGLLEAHVAAHRRYPAPEVGVLGYTRLDAPLAADPLMHFVTEVGCFLFSYPGLKGGDVLDFSYFWGGRSSCKRAFLLDHGAFNPVFRFGCEDIELGYRLSKHGFKVVYEPAAISTMVRGFSFDGFCNRLVRQGRSNQVFSRLHDDPVVAAWAEVGGAQEAWCRIEPVHELVLRSGRELDRIVRQRKEVGIGVGACDLELLHRGYYAAFRASKLKGIVEKAAEPPTAEAGAPSPGPVPGALPPAAPAVFSSPGLESLLRDVPSIHGGGAITYGLGEETLRFLDARVQRGSRTLETGAGMSTLLFAYKGADHVCITPSADEAERLRAYCRARGVSLDGTRFIVEFSQAALPKLEIAELDLALIDGGHGFPVPFVDWFFMAPRLRIGGLLVVDDTQLWTGGVLRDFLMAEPEWRLETRFPRGAAFRKIADRIAKEWNEQPYVLARSESPGRSSPEGLAAGGLGQGAR